MSSLLTVVTSRNQGQMVSDTIVKVPYYALLYKRGGCCTSIPVITGSDCLHTPPSQQQDLHKAISLKGSSSIWKPSYQFVVLRRKPEHKYHLKIIFRSSYYRICVGLSLKLVVADSSSYPNTQSSSDSSPKNGRKAERETSIPSGWCNCQHRWVSGPWFSASF